VGSGNANAIPSPVRRINAHSNGSGGGVAQFGGSAADQPAPVRTKGRSSAHSGARADNNIFSSDPPTDTRSSKGGLRNYSSNIFGINPIQPIIPWYCSKIELID
jgi:hypothetical protein